jgi:hypothetical protein
MAESKSPDKAKGRKDRNVRVQRAPPCVGGGCGCETPAHPKRASSRRERVRAEQRGLLTPLRAAATDQTYISSGGSLRHRSQRDRLGPGQPHTLAGASKPAAASGVPRCSRAAVALHSPVGRLSHATSCSLPASLDHRSDHRQPGAPAARDCGPHALSERVVGPARIVVESLTLRPGIREQYRPI